MATQKKSPKKASKRETAEKRKVKRKKKAAPKQRATKKKAAKKKKRTVKKKAKKKIRKKVKKKAKKKAKRKVKKRGVDMTKLDPHLTNFKMSRDAGGADQMHAFAADPSIPITYMTDAAPEDDDPLVRVIVRFESAIDSLVAAGFQPETIIGDVATGSINVSRLDDLDVCAELQGAEAAVQLSPSLDLSVPEIQADLVHSGPPGRRGSGVVVGVVDSGTDYTHGNFLDASGNSRIKRIWDQNLAPIAGEANPAGFTYGVEYDDSAINAALPLADPFAQVRHQDTGINHGTHVAGIAAGDGSLAGNGQPANTYIGVAPESTIVVVATDFSTAGVIDGVNYVFQVASAIGLPAVVNLSLGSEIGPHDGTSNFEQGIMNLVSGSGKVVVAATGNEGADNAHASGTVATAAPVNLTINVPNNRNAPLILDLWYSGAAAFGVAFQDPAGNATPNVAVGNNNFGQLSGNTVQVDHRNNDPNNGDKRIVVIVQPPVGGNITPGAWQLQLTATTATVGTFDVWMRNPPGQPIIAFPAAQATATGTIGTPATANRVISVGSYVTRGAGGGSLSTFSNRGPTRDGRPAPDVGAPGQNIFSANAVAVSPYQPMAGTSMATPHVTGVVALMLQKNGSYTWDQVRDCLRNSARTDAFTGATPNTAYGWGKVDALAAVACVASPLPPPLTRVPSTCPPPTRIGCPPPTRFFCPPPTRFFCPPPTRVFCPPPTRVNCPVPTRVNCPVPTRAGCPIPTRMGCPTPTRVCGFPFTEETITDERDYWGDQHENFDECLPAAY